MVFSGNNCFKVGHYAGGPVGSFSLGSVTVCKNKPQENQVLAQTKGILLGSNLTVLMATSGNATFDPQSLGHCSIKHISSASIVMT